VARAVISAIALAAIIEGHGGRLTIQAESPFTTVATQLGNTMLSDLEDRDHKIALSLASGRPDRLNVCHFTIYPGESGGRRSPRWQTYTSPGERSIRGRSLIS